MDYFVISNSDGDTHVRRYTEAEMAKMLADEDERGGLVNALADLTDSDTNYWRGVLILRGEVVQPQPVEKVTEWKMP